MFALALSVLAVACSGADAARNTGAPKNVGAQAPATVPLKAVTDPSAGLSFIASIVAAARSAESGPHGGIGEPATATSP